MPDVFTTISERSERVEESIDRSNRPNGDSYESETNISPPLSYYKKVNSKTYTESFFNISNDEYSKDIEIIEDYITKEIISRSFEDTTDSYNEIINEIIEYLSISKNEITKSKISKIVNYIKLLNKNITHEERLEKLHQKKKESDDRINKIKTML